LFAWLVVGGHLLAFGIGCVSDAVLATTTVASAVFTGFAWWVVRSRNLYALGLVLMFVGWCTFTFAYMNWVYVTFTDYRRGIHHDLTSLLAASLTGGAVLGAFCMHAWLGRDVLPARVSALVMRTQTLVYFGAIFLVICAGQLATGFLNARWTVPVAGQSDAGYVLNGIGPIGFAFFLVLGARLRPPLLSLSNALILGVVAVLAALQMLSGGRGYSMWMVLLTLWGAAWGRLSRRDLMILWSAAIAAGIVVSLAVQETRGTEDFASGGAGQRAALLLDQGSNLIGESYSDGALDLQPLIARMFELTVQIVVDQTVRTQHFAGFEDFDRLRFLFLPKAIAPEKGDLPISNGKEILAREFNVRTNKFTSVPLTLLGDAYRRGGELWVFGVGFCVGAWLRLLARLTLKIIGVELCQICFALYSLMIMSVHGDSLTGAISVLVYHWSKQILVFSVAALGLRVVIALSSAVKPAAHPMFER